MCIFFLVTRFSIFAKTQESAAPKFVVKDEKTGLDKLMVKYRGQASKEFQTEFYGGMKKGTVAEGVAFAAPCTGSAQDIIDNYCGSLRSALTYGGSKDIKYVHLLYQHAFFLENCNAKPNL